MVATLPFLSAVHHITDTEESPKLPQSRALRRACSHLQRHRSMAIGLTARQRADLAAMLPNIEESVTSLKRLITDAKDRTRALQKLDEAEAAHKRHAGDVGIPFNSEAFARRRGELNALPKVLTVEEGQFASFSALQRAIGVILEGPYLREGKGTRAHNGAQGKRAATKGTGTRLAAGKGSGAKRASNQKKASGKGASKPVSHKGSTGKSGNAKSARAKRANSASTVKPAQRAAAQGGRPSTSASARSISRSDTTATVDRSEQAVRTPVQKPLPLSLGS